MKNSFFGVTKMDRTRLNIELYKKEYLIRKSEETIRKYYMDDEMKTPVHLSVGEEAIVSGVIQAMGKRDQVFGTYRNHGIYLAKTGETDKFFAELYGKKDGMGKGKAGSMHMFLPEENFMGSSAIVATVIPVAVGAAFANKYKKNKNLVFVFFGDGALEEGVFWESLNFACLKKLPIVFICEDNGLAIHAHIKDRQAFKSITDIVSKFGCNVFKSESTDAEVIYNLTVEAVKKQRRVNKPSFLHLKYYRYLEHVGVNQDFQYGYRSEEEFKKWFKVDPLKIQRRKLLKLGLIEKEIKELEKAIDEQVEKSVEFAKKSPFPGEEELLSDVYA
ncbi:MAG: thiamine pyrophosphate-dependent dehydrogenase E1 component subunit alpha [Thermoplasmata archaeon]|nr:MAG: thiamine pyrophosphate-dependent dehydrogenase E1 component subunit alpha [Thermoplasmata archaeon]RLF52123.1 MAG: thiamine pyrophosphate-dependent dehydrogenase E1 component subunit alpha [Thermoplasmata archaeon]